MTVAIEAVLLVSTSDMVVTPMTCGVVNPVTDPAGLQEAVHVKLVPATSEISVTLKRVAEQIAAGALFVKWGEGLTVTMKLVVWPVHPLALGTI